MIKEVQDRVMELSEIESYDFSEKIENLMDGFESVDVEFKSAKGGFPRSLWESYSSFANTQGGIIVLGVKEKNEKFTLDGLSEEQVCKYKKEFWDNVNNKAHCSANILREKDVREVEFKGRFVLIFSIPRAQSDKIPVYLYNNPENTFKRNHEGDYRCDTGEIRPDVC